MTHFEIDTLLEKANNISAHWGQVSPRRVTIENLANNGYTEDEILEIWQELVRQEAGEIAYSECDFITDKKTKMQVYYGRI